MTSLMALLSQASAPTFQTRKALILLGLQNDFLSPDGKLVVSTKSGFLDRLKQLVPSFRESGEVIWVRSEFESNRELHSADESGDTVIAGSFAHNDGVADHRPGAKRSASDDSDAPAKRMRAADAEDDPELFLSRTDSREPCCMPGSWGAEYTPDVKALMHQKDLDVVKTYYSAFGSTSLLTTLRSRFITELFVCGCNTNLSVFATAMDAARYGIKITLIEDCLGFRQKSRHEEAIRQLVDIMGVDVMTSEKVVGILRNPPDPAADTEDEEEDDDNIPPFPRQPVPQEIITSSRDALPVDLSSALAVDSDPDQEGEEEEDGEEGEDGEDMSPPQVRASHSSSAHLPLRFNALLRTHSRRAAAVRPTTSSERAEPPVTAAPITGGRHPRGDVGGYASDAEPEGVLRGKERRGGKSAVEFAGDGGVAEPIAGEEHDEQTDNVAAVVHSTVTEEDQSVEPSSTAKDELKVNESLRHEQVAVQSAPRAVQTPATDDANWPSASPAHTTKTDTTSPTDTPETPATPDPATLKRPPQVMEQLTPAVSKTRPTAMTGSYTPDVSEEPSPDKPLPLFGIGQEAESAGSTLLHNLLSASLASTIFETLSAEVQWQTMHHQSGEVPRLVCCQGTFSPDNGSQPVYRHPSDETLALHPWSPSVEVVKRAAEEVVGHELNHVLIQLYRGGGDYISEHSDKTLDIAARSSIVNVSFGAQRTMRLRTKRVPRPINADDGSGTTSASTSLSTFSSPEGQKRTTHRIPLPHNSLLTMSLPTNAQYLHSIPADKRPAVELTEAEKAYKGQRISLTFRRIATFLSADGEKIWGQGATGKTREEAKHVVNGDGRESAKLVRAFGAENASSSIDWSAVYGEGSDVLHLTSIR
jgi:nicotinamidase-related amidase/alkylated DNA repair dioxygenase AlkB